MNNRLVVFDLDGTLNKTDLYAVPAHRKALLECGISGITDEFIISTFGARSMDAAPSLLNTNDINICREYISKVSKYESELIKDLAGEFDGITTMLSTLKDKGFEIAVCSNASERYIRMVLDVLNLTRFVDYVQPLLDGLTKNDTLKLLLEKVNPNKAVMVGDRIYDKLAAKHNHIQFIGCLYGFNQSEVADADYPVVCPLDIIDVVQYAMDVN